MLSKSVSGQRGQWVPGSNGQLSIKQTNRAIITNDFITTKNNHACNFVFLSKSSRSLDIKHDVLPNQCWLNILHHRSYILPQCLLGIRPRVCWCWVCSLWSDTLLLTAAWWSRRPGSRPGGSASPPRPTTTTRRQTAAASADIRRETGAGAGSAATPGTSPGRDGWEDTGICWTFTR